MPDVIQADTVVEKSTEVEYAVKNPRIEKFIKSLENNCWRTAKDLGQSLGGSKYNYVFNDYGIHGVGYNQEIFCRLYFRQLNQMLQKFVGDIFNKVDYKDKFTEKSIEYDNLWKRIVADAESKGAVVKSNEYELGLYFYVILYLRCIYELNKESDKFKDTQCLRILQKQGENFRVSFESPDDMQKIIDDIRKDLEDRVLNLDKAHNMIESMSNDMSIQTVINKMNNGYEFSINKQELDIQPKTEEPKQSEPVEDIDNKDETLESKDKQIDDDLSSEENKDINTETDDSNIEDLSDTDTEETDMRVVKDTVKHEAFGVQIDFDIPDFIKINDDPRWFNELKNNGYVLERYLDSESANRRLFLFDFSGTKESFNDNIISVYDAVSKKMVQDSVSVLSILYMMANELAGLNPDNTEQDIMSSIQNKKWIKGLALKHSYLRNRYLVIKDYNPEEEQ